MRSSLWSSAFLFVSFCTPSHAQVVAGYGYKLPGNSIVAAPGQVMMFSINGVAARLTDPVFPVGGLNGLPTVVNGLSVEFVQGLVTVQMPIRGVQQSACPTTGSCSPATSFTIQIPYELDVESREKPLLRVRENAAILAEVAVNPVTDSVHVINSCDQTGIYLSLAFGVPAGTCAPMVMHARGPLVSSTSPALAGETLILWAWGLGAINHPTPVIFTSVDAIPVAVQPFQISFSYFDQGRFPLRRLSTVVPTYTGMSGAGLYQVQFVVPDPPASLSACRTGQGNLRVVVSGPSSADFAEICLAGR